MENRIHHVSKTSITFYSALVCYSVAYFIENTKYQNSQKIQFRKFFPNLSLKSLCLFVLHIDYCLTHGSTSCNHQSLGQQQQQQSQPQQTGEKQPKLQQIKEILISSYIEERRVLLDQIIGGEEQEILIERLNKIDDTLLELIRMAI